MAPPKDAEAYSTNKSTMKNRARRNKANEIELAELKSQTATNTASSKFWSKKFKPAAQGLLSTPNSEVERKALEIELRKQSNNVATQARFEIKKHYSQEGRIRIGNTKQWLEKEMYFVHQDRIFDLGLEFLPPSFVIDAAKVRVRLSDSKEELITEPITPGPNADQIQKLPEVEPQDAEELIGKAMEQAKAKQWSCVQIYWQEAIEDATDKFLQLEAYGIGDTIVEMSTAKFKEYYMFLGGDPGDHAHFREVTNINRDYRIQMVKDAIAKSDRMKTRKIRTDSHSGCAIPPFSMWFRRRERIVMALLLQIQLAGKFLGAQLQLAVDGERAILPAPYKESTIDSRKFPVNSIDNNEAELLLSGIFAEGDSPDDITPWIMMGDIGVRNEDNKEDEPIHRPSDHEGLSTDDSELYWSASDDEGDILYINTKITREEARAKNAEAWASMDTAMEQRSEEGSDASDYVAGPSDSEESDDDAGTEADAEGDEDDEME